MNILLVNDPPPVGFDLSIQEINQIAQIVATVLVLIYVIYTYKTFRQIKKQTDYQQDAYLRVDAVLSEPRSTAGSLLSRDTYIDKYVQKELHEKMKSILQPIVNLESNLFEGKYFTVILTNYGNAEVHKICLTLSITIQNSEELVTKKMLRSTENNSVNIEIEKIIGRKGQKVYIPLIPTGSFPIFNIELKGNYFDIRNKKYQITSTIVSGQNPHLQKLPAAPITTI